MESLRSGASGSKEQEVTQTKKNKDHKFFKILELGVTLGQFLSDDTANRVRVVSKDCISAANQCQILTYKKNVFQRLKTLVNLSYDPTRYDLFLAEAFSWDPETEDFKALQKKYQNKDVLLSCCIRQMCNKLVNDLLIASEIDQIKNLCEKVLDLCPILDEEEKGAMLSLCSKKLGKKPDLYLKLRIVKAMPVGRVSTKYENGNQSYLLKEAYILTLFNKFLFDLNFDEAERVASMFESPYMLKTYSIKLAEIYVQIGRFEKAIEFLNKVEGFDVFERVEELIYERNYYSDESERYDESTENQYLDEKNKKIYIKKDGCVEKLYQACLEYKEFDTAIEVVKNFKYFDSCRASELADIQQLKTSSKKIGSKQDTNREEFNHATVIDQLVTVLRKQLASDKINIDTKNIVIKLDLLNLESLKKDFITLDEGGSIEVNGISITREDLIGRFDKIFHNIVKTADVTEILYKMVAVLYLNNMYDYVSLLESKFKTRLINIHFPILDPRKYLLRGLNKFGGNICYREDLEMCCLMITGRFKEVTKKIKALEERLLEEYQSKFELLDRDSNVYKLLLSPHRKIDKQLCQSVDDMKTYISFLKPFDKVIEKYKFLVVSLLHEGNFREALKVVNMIKHPLKQKQNISDNITVYQLIFDAVLKKRALLSGDDLSIININPKLWNAYYFAMASAYIKHHEVYRKSRHINEEHDYIDLADKAIDKIYDPDLKAKAYLSLLKLCFFEIDEAFIDKIILSLRPNIELLDFMSKSPYLESSSFELSAYFLSQVVQFKKEVFSFNSHRFWETCFSPIDFNSPSCISYIDTIFALAKEYRRENSHTFARITYQYIQSGLKFKALEVLPYITEDESRARLTEKVESM